MSTSIPVDLPSSSPNGSDDDEEAGSKTRKPTRSHASSGSSASSVNRRGTLNRHQFPLHEAAYLGKFTEVRNILQKNKRAGQLVLQVNSEKRTPLHECARGDGSSQSTKIAETLLSYVPAEQLNSYLSQLDDDNSTAIYYAVNNSNSEVVKVLLEAEAKSKFNSERISGEVGLNAKAQNYADNVGPNSLIYLATENGSIDVLKLLFKYGYVVGPFQYGVLLKEAVRQKNSSNHVEIFKFLLDSLMKSETADEILEEDDSVKYILHYAAKRCNLEVLKILSNIPGDDFPFLRKNKHFTPIHYTLKSWGDEKFAECMRVLLTKCYANYEGDMLYEELFNSKDCPLTFAFAEMRLHNAPYFVVESLLENILQNPECWEKFRQTESIISRLYSKTPEVLPKLMNQCVKLENFESIKIDFACVIPVQEDRLAGSKNSLSRSSAGPETRYLHKILDEKSMVPKQVRKAILLHPIVKLYLELKYKSFYAFNLFCCFTQIVFLSAFTYLIPAKYSMDEYENNATSNCPEAHIIPEIQDDTIAETGTETVNHLWILAGLIVLVYVIPMGLKELWHMASYRLTYISSATNLVKLTNLICVVLVCLDTFRNGTDLYLAAAIGGLLSWVLFLRELSKIFTEYNIWASALLKVVTRSIKLALYFLPILIGFYLMFQVLIPWRNFHNWLGGLGHMLVLMTGEFEYDETFNKPNSTKSQLKLFLGTSSFLLFVMVAVISLSNLLVAVAVEDIAKLRRDSEFKSLASRLEYMYSLEKTYVTFSEYRFFKLIIDCCGHTFAKISNLCLNVFGCFCVRTRRTTVSNMASEISPDGMLSIPCNLISEDDLRAMNLL